MTSVGDVLAIIDATIKVVKTTETIRHADKEMEELRQWIQTLADTLRQFIGASATLTGENKRQFDSINAQIESRMASVQKRLVGEERGFKRRLNRLLWPARKGQAKEDIEAIGKLDDQVRKVFETQDIEDGKLQRLIAWLRPEIHPSLMKTPARVQNLTDGTIEWIWENKQYRDWGNSESGILWVFGIQGSGKTGVAEYVSSTLRQEAGTPPAYHVARVFCDHQTLPGLKDHLDIVMSFWCQLERSIGGLVVDRDTLNRWTPKLEAGPFLPYKDQTELKKDVLSYTISKAGRTLFILDGLDEVPTEHQAYVVETLRDILKRNNQCRLMITSRPYANLTALAVDQPKLVLKATPHDIELYIRDRISRSTSHFLHRHEITEGIIHELSSKCEGTFLMAKLHMDEVLKAESESDCWYIIRNLPTEASQAYEKGLVRLATAYRKPQSDLPCSAIQALFWVVFAKFRMTTGQLKQALAVKATDTKYNRQNEIVQSIDTLCGEMLIVDPQYQEVRVAHKTISDYLMRPETQRTWFPNIQRHIHLTLIRYLSLDDLNEPLSDPEMTKQFDDRHPLLPYALEYWGTDMTKVLDNEPLNSELWQVTERFLKSQHSDWNSHVLEEVARLFERVTILQQLPFPGALRAIIPGRIGGLHWVVLFSLNPFIKMCYEHEKQHPVESGISYPPLGLAAPLGEVEIARQLLEAGACPDGSDYDSRSKRPPLYDAVLCGPIDIISLLLEHGASLTQQRALDEESPLDLLYNTEYGSFAYMLVDRIPGRASKSHAEYLFLIKGAFGVQLRMAIQNGLDVNQPCGNGKCALDYALEFGNEEIISILKEYGAVTKLQWNGWRSHPSKWLQHCPEPYIPGTRIVQQLLSEKDSSVTLRSDRIQDPIYDFDSISSPSVIGNSDLLMEIVIDERIKLPVRAVVFETVSRGQGWSEESFTRTSYLSSGKSWFDVRVVNGEERSQPLRVQNNVRNDKTVRLHTNIWDLDDTETLSPLRVKLIESLQYGSKLQVFGHAAWEENAENRVFQLRVSVYGQVRGRDGEHDSISSCDSESSK